MAFDIIQRLREAEPEMRASILERMRQKNMAFFAKVNPPIAKFLSNAPVNTVEIDLTEQFLAIRDRDSGQYCHSGELDEHAIRMANPYHTDWIDLLREGGYHFFGEFEHSQKVLEFQSRLAQIVPQMDSAKAVANHCRIKEIKLPHSQKSGKDYSGFVVFMGIFHGLHIAEYLRQNLVTGVYLIEPNLEYFALSCYFLDYEEIYELGNKRLFMTIGEYSADRMAKLLQLFPVSTRCWLRILPAYKDEQFHQLVDSITLDWQSIQQYVPTDREIAGIRSELDNVANGYLDKTLKSLPSLRKTDVAVCASGPSLKEHLPWLKEHQDKLFIVSMLSTYAVLHEAGIKPDILCMLDDSFHSLDVFKVPLDIPVLAPIRLSPELLNQLQNPVLFYDELSGHAHKVEFYMRFAQPTSGNLAVAFAAGMKPRRLILFGYDMGSTDRQKIHSNTTHPGFQLAYERATWTVYPHANRPETKEVFTQSYLNNARQFMEIALQHFKVDVINLSDGVRIKGAKYQPDVLTEVARQARLDKAWVMERLRQCQGVVATPFNTTISQFIDCVREVLLEKIHSLDADWAVFPKMLDGMVFDDVRQCHDKEGLDRRNRVYLQQLVHYLEIWMRSQLLVNQDSSKSQMVFDYAFTALQEEINQWHWRSETDTQSEGGL